MRPAGRKASQRRGGTASEGCGAICHPKGDTLSAHGVRGVAFRIHRNASFAVTPQLCLRRPHLFSRKRKDGGEKSAWGREIALTREKACRSVVRFFVPLSVVRTPLRATVESGFLSARQILRVVTLAPVEYLTYGNRNASAPTIIAAQRKRG